MQPHRAFLDRFPDHREVDQVSTAQFLTALSIYDCLLLDGGSKGHYDSQVDVIPDSEHEIIRGFCSSWVRDLLKELPAGVDDVVDATDLEKDIEERNVRARKLAFKLFASPLGERLRLRHGEKLPDVYTAESYVDRPFFEQMNSEAGSPLSHELLAQAMFLHRGLLLQACVDADFTYLPYLYRGRMLESVPPSVPRQIVDSTELIVPLASNTLPGDAESVKTLQPVLLRPAQKAHVGYIRRIRPLHWCGHPCQDRIRFGPFIRRSHGIPTEGPASGVVPRPRRPPTKRR